MYSKYVENYNNLLNKHYRKYSDVYISRMEPITLFSTIFGTKQIGSIIVRPEFMQFVRYLVKKDTYYSFLTLCMLDDVMSDFSCNYTTCDFPAVGYSDEELKAIREFRDFYFDNVF